MHSNGTKVHNIIHLSEKLAKTIRQKIDTNNHNFSIKFITLTKDNTTSNNTSNSSTPGATQFSIDSFELVY